MGALACEAWRLRHAAGRSLRGDFRIMKQGGTDSLRCGEATAGQTVQRTVAKRRLSNPPSKYSNAQKDQSERIGLFVAVLNLIYNFVSVFNEVRSKTLRAATLFDVPGL